MRYISNFSLRLAATLLFQLASINLNAQQLQWAKAFTGDAFVEIFGQTTDSEGNIYSTGQYLGNIDFDPGPGNNILSSVGSGNVDAFISKLDINGNYIYAKTIGGNQNDIGISVAVNNSGELYVAGTFRSTADLDPGPGVLNFSSAGGIDFFVLKLDANGNLMWLRTFGGDDDDECMKIILTPAGELLITGVFRNQVDFDPGPDAAILNGGPFGDIFLLKLSADGNHIWSKKFGGNGTDIGTSIALTANDEILLGGRFQFTINLSQIQPGVNNIVANGQSDCFIFHLNANGQLIHAISYGGAENDFLYQLVYSDQKIIIGGSFRNSVDFNPGSGIDNRTSQGQEDLYILQLDLQLNYLWCYTKGGAQNDRTLGLALSNNGHILATGQYMATIDFGTSGSAVLSSNGITDIFFIRLNSQGQLISAASYGSTDVDYGRTITILNNVIFLSGSFSQSVQFDNDVNNTVTSSLASGVFIAKYSCESISTSLNVQACNYYVIPTGPGSVIVYTESTIDTLTFISNSGCDSIIYLNLEIYKPQAQISIAGNTLICNTNDVIYQWIDCDNNYQPIMNENNALFNATQSGNYAVIVTQNSCSDTSDCISVIISDIPQTDLPLIQIYPIPTKDQLFIRLTQNGNNVSIKCFDVTGMSYEIPYSNSDNVIQMYTGLLPAGHYILQVLDTESIRQFRFVK